MLHQNTTVIRELRRSGRNEGCDLRFVRAMSPKLGQLLKIIKLTRLELLYEEKLWIYTYDLQENNITITQIQLVLVAAS